MAGHLKHILDRDEPNALYPVVTVGQVVDVDDPQEMGRLRVVCPALGDSLNTPVADIPWASYLSPFGGTVREGPRGRSDADLTEGPVAYGMWAIPKVGATAMVVCIDGDTRFRVWMGCIHGQFLPHTLPHGRFKEDDEFGTGEPAGPVSSEEFPIEPTSTQLELAFTKSQDTLNVGAPATPKSNHEYKSRGADHSVASLSAAVVESTQQDISYAADAEEQGYTQNREHGFKESQVYSLTTPGFHSISMDDSDDNCRVRIRTTHGSQVLIDDTNERIYISTAQGDTYVELDEKGNVDVYAKRNISFHAEKDFNITADTIRMKADSGIHMVSEGEMRMHSKANDLHIKSDANIQLETTTDFKIKATNVFVGTSANVDIQTSTNGGIILDGGSIDLDGYPGNITQSATEIHMNGPSAATGTGVDGSAQKEAWWTDRVPEHEPWARMMTDAGKTDQDSGNTHASAGEHSYDDDSVNKVERGENLGRNSKWRR